MKKMREICENCNFYGYRPSDDADFREFIQRLTRLIDDYERQEATSVQVYGATDP